MLLDCVLTSVNENKLYIDFIPIFIKTWKKLYPNIDVKIILISNDIPNKFLIFKNNIILFKPINNILTSFTSQFIRLLYPCILNYKNGILITDIDMLPMNRTYYTENIKSFNNEKFIYYRENVCFKYKQLAMCYNIAVPKIWKDIFKINSLENIKDKLKEVSESNIIKEGHGNIGWCTDQIFLYDMIMKWKNVKNDFICLKENKTGFKRLDRIKNFDINNKKLQIDINKGKFTDYHCLRPMNKYSKINWAIYELLS